MQKTRASGILLHPTSLPGPHGCGELGKEAYNFLDWLAHAGQTLWQVLPLGPVGYGNSPYSSLSAFACNPLLIDLGDLHRRGWLARDEVPTGPHPAHRVDYPRVTKERTDRLRKAAGRFFDRGAKDEAFEHYCRTHARWLDDYALFMALNDRHGGREWSSWERSLATREKAAMDGARRELAWEVRFHQFTQWVFFEQWAGIRRAAAERQIKLVGDIPIFVAYHSADVWAHPEVFHLDANRRPTVVAGVPPDYFSATGQRWGNPLYRWEDMEANGYAWWRERFRAVFEQVDIARIDHFRGFQAYWEIPAEEPTAENGRWVEGPGARIFEAVREEIGELPIIAEDLGMITDDVRELLRQVGFPGMRVLQFAFGSGPENLYLPHNYESNTVVYTGTHDNDTSAGWFASAGGAEKDYARKYLCTDGSEFHWDLIRAASQSVADTALFPLQDVLGLGSEARMNRPGKPDRNWEWRFSWDQVPPEAGTRLAEITGVYGRASHR